VANKTALNLAIRILADDCLDWFDLDNLPDELLRQIKYVTQNPFDIYQINHELEDDTDHVLWHAEIDSCTGLFHCDITVRGYHENLPALYNLEVIEKTI
jgi:hypothetical protein